MLPVILIFGCGLLCVILGFVVSLPRLPAKLETITGLFIQGMIAGIEGSLIWWLAGKGAWILGRLIIDGIVGLLAVALLFQIVVLIPLLREARKPSTL